MNSKMNVLTLTDFKFPQQTSFYKGKVRDVYTIDGKYLVMVATDRISAFDVVLPRGIPYKGQVLNQLASRSLNATRDVVPNWLIANPDPVVSVGRICQPFKVEMVVRGYLAGHAARTYLAGGRKLCGVRLPEGLKENDRFERPIITPTTKAAQGHDQDISREEIIEKNIVKEDQYMQLEQYTLALYARGSEIAEKQGLILVDTKYEFGLGEDGLIYLIDEIHTPDSSRYFYSDAYFRREHTGSPPKQLSKEFVRQWLIAEGFQGKEGQVIPEMSDDWVNEISQRYIELFEKVTGEVFIPANNSAINKRIEENINNYLQILQ